MRTYKASPTNFPAILHWPDAWIKHEARFHSHGNSFSKPVNQILRSYGFWDPNLWCDGVHEWNDHWGCFMLWGKCWFGVSVQITGLSEHYWLENAFRPQGTLYCFISRLYEVRGPVLATCQPFLVTPVLSLLSSQSPHLYILSIPSLVCLSSFHSDLWTFLPIQFSSLLSTWPNQSSFIFSLPSGL